MTVPHAFHQNLPPHHYDEDGVSYITKFAKEKAQSIVNLALSIRIEERYFRPDAANDSDEASLAGIIKKCGRLQNQISTLDGLKHNILQQDLMKIIVHLLKLVTCTVELLQDNQVKLHYDQSAYIWTDGDPTQSYQPQPAEDREFALPTPARETLLHILSNILGNKGPLRSVSNSAIYPHAQKGRQLLIIHWQALLRMLLRTAPYLDERKLSKPSLDSNSRQTNIVRRTVQLIRDCRHFFDQGVRPDNSIGTDMTSKAIWNMVKTDILYHSHSHACYRGSIILYLFLPTRASNEFYQSVMPDWVEAWSNIDRCPEFDFLWLVLLCRARKHVKYDWTMIRRRLLTNAQYWLQLPIGGTGMDKSFPRAANPRSRSCPSSLKIFVGQSSIEEGIDFVAKVAKLFVANLGTGDLMDDGIAEGTADILRFLGYVTPYFHPSNIGTWTMTLGAFLHCFSYELCARIGREASLEYLRSSDPPMAEELQNIYQGSASLSLPSREIVALLDSLLPLCQQALYSKISYVGRAGETAMLYLIQLDPERAIPSFVEFALRALDIGAVNMSHQAPSAISALTRLFQPALRANPSYMLSRLPELLGLSLAGIDSNDQNKCIRTLIMYRGLVSWLPIGGDPSSWPHLHDHQSKDLVREDGTRILGQDLYAVVANKRLSNEYVKAIEALPDSSLLKMIGHDSETDTETKRMLLQEASSVMSDWVLELLERIYGLLRASGEREKSSKNAGVASRHTSADVHQARNFCRILKECMVQAFASMDDSTHSLATKSVVRFLEQETLSNAAKDASMMCQAVAAARASAEGVQSSPGLRALVPLLTDDLDHQSTKTVIYRLRCLSGAVRTAGIAVLDYKQEISKSLSFALKSEDRHLFKTGCKLLRHTLMALTESYIVSTSYRARVKSEGGDVTLAISSEIFQDPPVWFAPSKECIEYAYQLLQTHLESRLDDLCSSAGGTEFDLSRLFFEPGINALRRCLRVARYCLRGSPGLMVDFYKNMESPSSLVPNEKASLILIGKLAEEQRSEIMKMRRRLGTFIIAISGLVSSDTLYPSKITDLPDNHPVRKTLPLIASDSKISKEVTDISLLLLTRRGAHFRSKEARSVWRAQRQVLTDFALGAFTDRIVTSLQAAHLFGTQNATFKDGENGGKILPRRLLMTRVQIFNDSLQRLSSFEVPRRLRKFDDSNRVRETLFRVPDDLVSFIDTMNSLLKGIDCHPLDIYEAIYDSLNALCCHSNSQTRAASVGVIDYAVTRFGWLVNARVPRMLSSLTLDDSTAHGQFGLPSCSSLVELKDSQGKRKRLADSVKGICAILALARSTKALLSSQALRMQFVETMLKSDQFVSLMPAEDSQKAILYFQTIFNPFRSKFYELWLDGYSSTTIGSILSLLSEDPIAKTDSDETGNRGAVHWRKRLLAGWFLQIMISSGNVNTDVTEESGKIWKVATDLLLTEMGQPLQKVALAILGRLVSLASPDSFRDQASSTVTSATFCESLAQALVHDHREDKSANGGHSAQWSAGVEDIVRDASRHISPRSLFPFQRTSLSSSSFKVSHCRLVESILLKSDPVSRKILIDHLLASATTMIDSSPSEDQKNQQLTAAELYAGIAHACIQTMDQEQIEAAWRELLIPKLSEFVSKAPFSMSGAFCDALRYCLQSCPADKFLPLTAWLFDKVKATIWQPSSKGATLETEDTATIDGFTAQSKWLSIFSALVIEINDEGIIQSRVWYDRELTSDYESMEMESVTLSQKMADAWKIVTDKMLTQLVGALGHPYDNCRIHISLCIFRICYSHRKLTRLLELGNGESIASKTLGPKPGISVVKALRSLSSENEISFVEKCNALSTARLFISYCIHLGEAKFEFSEHVIDLLPLVFESLESKVESEMEKSGDASAEEKAAKRAAEADVIKSYRETISQLCIYPVISYGQSEDIDSVIDIVKNASKSEVWQVRHAAINFARCFEGAHKFLLSKDQSAALMEVVIELLSDPRSEVSAAATAAMTGQLSAMSTSDVEVLVDKYTKIASKSKTRKKVNNGDQEASGATEVRRAKEQQCSVNVLCAVVLSRPYDTPPFVPKAILAISKHSFARNAPSSIRNTVKKCCAEFKKTHMSDNWQLHRQAFNQEQLEALEDVVSSPHYYA